MSHQPSSHSKGQSWRNRFLCAARGLREGTRGQPVFAVHFMAAILVLGLAAVLALPVSRWCVLILCIGLVIGTELLNSALEGLASSINHEFDPGLGRALDIASGAVLAVAITAAAAGCLVFGEAIFFNPGS